MRLILTAISISIATIAAQASERETAITEMTSGILERVIRPAFTDFRDQSAEMRYRMSDLCGGPSRSAMADVQQQFKALTVAYARIEMLRFGPLTQKNRFERDPVRKSGR